MDKFLQQTTEQFYKFKYLSTVPVFSNIYLTRSDDGELSLRSSGNGCEIFILIPGLPVQDPTFTEEDGDIDNWADSDDEQWPWVTTTAEQLQKRAAVTDIPFISEQYDMMKCAGFSEEKHGRTNFAIASWLQARLCNLITNSENK